MCFYSGKLLASLEIIVKPLNCWSILTEVDMKEKSDHKKTLIINCSHGQRHFGTQSLCVYTSLLSHTCVEYFSELTVLTLKLTAMKNVV